MTPIEHDTILLDLGREWARAEQHVTWALNTLRSYTDTMPYSLRHPSRFGRVVAIPDTRTPDEVYTQARAGVDHEGKPLDSYTGKYQLPQAVERYDLAVQAVSEAVSAYLTHEKDYTGWNRYWLVTSSPGHIHRSTNCVSCYPRTTYALVPQLSAKRVDQAIDLFGPAMCSVCFPSAPVATVKVGKALAESVGTEKFDKLLAKHTAKIGASS